MGLNLTESDVDAFLTQGHTVIVTTLRRDGWPVSLPVWFVWLDSHVYVATPPRAAKITRIRHDDRATLLVESGEKWVELAAWQIYARAVVLDADGEEAQRALAAFETKYADFTPPFDLLPPAARRAYAERAVIRFDQVGDAISWDNSKMRLQAGAQA